MEWDVFIADDDAEEPIEGSHLGKWCDVCDSTEP
jgi:hypothetical protein